MDDSDDARPVKVHRVVLLIVDLDEVGADGIKTVIETARYPSHCIMPQVMSVDTREVRWTDSHPLNMTGKTEQAFDDLFDTDNGDRKP